MRTKSLNPPQSQPSISCSSSSLVLDSKFDRGTQSPFPAGARLGNSDPRRPHSRGIMLVECLVYIAILFILMGVAFTAFYRVFKQNSYLGQNAADIVRVLQVGERWREDIRNATGAPQLMSSPNRQELRIPQSNGQVVYTIERGTIRRRPANHPSGEELLIAVAASRMQPDPRTHVTAWRWELELQGKQKVARVKPLFTFLAVPPTSTQP